VRRALIVGMIAALAHAPSTARAEDQVLGATQFASTQRAIGWWLGGASVATGATGACALALGTIRTEAEANNLQIGAGIALVAVAAAALGTSIILLSTDVRTPAAPPRTEHDADEAGLRLTPFGVVGWF
jgi:hypothetical protein